MKFSFYHFFTCVPYYTQQCLKRQQRKIQSQTMSIFSKGLQSTDSSTLSSSSIMSSLFTDVHTMSINKLFLAMSLSSNLIPINRHANISRLRDDLFLSLALFRSRHRRLSANKAVPWGKLGAHISCKNSPANLTSRKITSGSYRKGCPC